MGFVHCLGLEGQEQCRHPACKAVHNRSPGQSDDSAETGFTSPRPTLARDSLLLRSGGSGRPPHHTGYTIFTTRPCSAGPEASLCRPKLKSNGSPHAWHQALKIREQLGASADKNGFQRALSVNFRSADEKCGREINIPS